MACRGVLFALSPDQFEGIGALKPGGDKALMRLIESIEGAWDAEWLQETDKAWDSIHRCLTNGQLEWGDTPLHRCILGPRNLHSTGDYLVNLVKPGEVVLVAQALHAVDESEIRPRHALLDEQYLADAGEHDLEYTLGWFEPVKAFYNKVAKAGRAVLFTVDQ